VNLRRRLTGERQSGDAFGIDPVLDVGIFGSCNAPVNDRICGELALYCMRRWGGLIDYDTDILTAAGCHACLPGRYAVVPYQTASDRSAGALWQMWNFTAPGSPIPSFGCAISPYHCENQDSDHPDETAQITTTALGIDPEKRASVTPVPGGRIPNVRANPPTTGGLM
jgi:hypothetical protein